MNITAEGYGDYETIGKYAPAPKVKQATERAAMQRTQTNDSPPPEEKAETKLPEPATASHQGESLLELIRSAQETIAQQKEMFQIKSSVSYKDAPLDAYARLARAKSQQDVSSAAGYTRRRLYQLKTALRTSPDQKNEIRTAMAQLQKLLNRATKKKKELTRETLLEQKHQRAEEEARHQKAERLKMQLRIRRTARKSRENGYLSESASVALQQAQRDAANAQYQQQCTGLHDTAVSPSSVSPANPFATDTAPVPTDAAASGSDAGISILA